VLAGMIKQGMEPNVVTYNSLMDGYFLVKEVNKATYVFNTIARRGVALDVQSYSYYETMEEQNKTAFLWK
jgi:pentatricopeptide repeat domain-containing protein 1